MLILVADDNADARRTLRILLELEGHTVFEAANGRDAVDVATRTRPNVILMDLNMPVMDGPAAIRILRADPSTAETRVVVISALGDHPEWKRRAAQCGCDMCLVKPVDLRSLRQVIGQPPR